MLVSSGAGRCRGVIFSQLIDILKTQVLDNKALAFFSSFEKHAFEG